MTIDVNEFSTMDATAQAELMRRRELTPLELVDAALARIERINPTINALLMLFEESPLIRPKRSPCTSGLLFGGSRFRAPNAELSFSDYGEDGVRVPLW
jgi:hypothetical protein